MWNGSRIGILGFYVSGLMLLFFGAELGSPDNALGFTVSVLGLVAFLVAWVWALFMMLLARQWGWMVLHLLIPGLGMVLYALSPAFKPAQTGPRGVPVQATSPALSQPIPIQPAPIAGTPVSRKGRVSMSRWISRLVLIIWPGGVIAYQLAIGGHVPPPYNSWLSSDAFVRLWVGASFPWALLVAGLSVAEAAMRRQTGWVIAQVLSLPVGPALYILFARQRCSGCLGSGRRRIGCPTCNGTGVYGTGSMLTPYGPAPIGLPCGTCGGRGYFDQGSCPYCRGTGRTTSWDAGRKEHLHPLAAQWRPNRP